MEYDSVGNTRKLLRFSVLEKKSSDGVTYLLILAVLSVEVKQLQTNTRALFLSHPYFVS